MCHLCKYWSPSYPQGIKHYDPAKSDSWYQVVSGKCGNLRIMAAYKKVPTTSSYYYCNFYEEKEKDDGRK